MPLPSHIWHQLVCPFILFLALCSPAAQAQEEDKLPFKVPADYRSLPAIAHIETTKGAFYIKFYRKQAPISVANFKYVVEKGLYTGTKFHKLSPGMFIQGGDPTGTGKGGPKWTLPPEISSQVRHQRGAMAWGRLPNKINEERRSIASQFYITLRPIPGLDGFYTVFAQVIRGMENIDQLRVGDRILSVSFPKQIPDENSE